MFRITNSLTKLTLTVEPFVQTTTLQSIRWRRKPRWIPQSKSKIFKVPARPVVPLEEQEELKRLNNNYRTFIKSIRRYMVSQTMEQKQQTVDVEVVKQQFEKDFSRCNEINEKWNAEQAVRREARVLKTMQEEAELARTRLAERTEINKNKLAQAEEMVREQKKLARTFITRENIDEAIEKALVNVVDYNFAIEVDGTRIVGRDGVSELKKVEGEKISVKQ